MPLPVPGAAFFLLPKFRDCGTLVVENRPKRGGIVSKFVIRAVRSGLKFDLRAANGQTILTSEVYTTMTACRKGIASVVKNAPGAKVENQTEPGWVPLTNPKFELYRDRAGDYRFRLKARNGQIIAVSENYSGRAGCLNGLDSVRKNAAEAEIVEE